MYKAQFTEIDKARQGLEALMRRRSSKRVVNLAKTPLFNMELDKHSSI